MSDVVPHVALAMVIELIALGLFAGWLGAMIGIGGGVIIVPVLVLAFGIDIKLAVATSLVAVVATSTAAGSVYVGKGLSNMRLGMSLEIATTLGGISGGILGVLVSPTLIAGLFSALMGMTAALMLKSGKDKPAAKAAACADDGPAPELGEEPVGHEDPGKIGGSYYDPFHKRLVQYEATRIWVGGGISFFAGIVSGMLGVGGGFIKVPAMNLGMRVPIKVAAATSNFMIGVTAISSLFVYLARGLVHPMIACPVALGVVGGALSGTQFAGKVSPKLLRRILAAVLILVGIQMLFKALGVTLG